jgi:hypothetical protein
VALTISVNFSAALQPGHVRRGTGIVSDAVSPVNEFTGTPRLPQSEPITTGRPPEPVAPAPVCSASSVAAVPSPLPTSLPKSRRLTKDFRNAAPFGKGSHDTGTPLLI